MTSFHECGSIASWLAEPIREAGLLFPIKFPEIAGTHFIDLGRMKDRVDLGSIQCSSSWDP